MNKTLIVIILLFFIPVSFLYSFDILGLFRHSEIAEKNSLFIDVGIAPVPLKNINISFLPAEIRADYFPPLPLPFSFGLFMKTPDPNFKTFGTRAAYHVDLFNSLTDLYVVHVFDFGFLRNNVLLEYNDTPVPVHLFDFRVGVRRFFSSRMGLNIETGFKFESVIFLLTIKIN